MGSSKLKFKFLLLAVGISSVFGASEYEQWLQKEQQSYQTYKKSISEEYKAYKKAYTEGLKEYKQNISKNWPTVEKTTKHKWVQYDKDYETKKVVDFKKKEINIEVIAKNEEEAKQKIKQLTKEILKEDVKSAYKNDKLQQKINQKLKVKPPVIKDNKKIVSDMLTKQEMLNIIERLKTKPVQKVVHNGKFIYKTNVKLPSSSLIRKAQQFRDDVRVNARKQEIPMELVYAIMHSESSFNPMARSHIPAYGLMQIVPKTAGVDTYKFLYGKKRLLSSSYLYDPSKNIKIGSAYLHILYYRYLKTIKNPTSRLYCAIAAYNTGAGNVAKSFIGNYNIRKASEKINQLTPNEVYEHLRKKLPYNETRKYLVKVTGRMNSYHKLVGKEL